jgi:hypothetical protein
MPGQHLPPDHGKGDERTIGGYAAVHGRPAAFEGPDGVAYSVEIMVDPVERAEGRFGAYLLFVKWRRIGASGAEGHVETAYLAFAPDESRARAQLAALPLAEAKRHLDALVRAAAAPTRRWWDAMREEGDA